MRKILGRLDVEAFRKGEGAPWIWEVCWVSSQESIKVSEVGYDTQKEALEAGVKWVLENRTLVKAIEMGRLQRVRSQYKAFLESTG